MRLILTDEAGLPAQMEKVQSSARTAVALFCSVGHETVARLSDTGVKRVGIARDDGARKAFLAEYVDLMAAIGKEADSREWWATHLASKNRFNSRMPRLLEQVAAAKQAVDAGHEVLFAVGGLPGIAPAVRGLGVDVVRTDGPLDRIGDAVLPRARWLGEVVVGMVRALWRRYYARRLLLGRWREEMLDRTPRLVVKTFIYPHSFTESGGYNDSAFGALAGHLKEAGKRVLVYGLVLKRYRECVRKMAGHTGLRVVPVEMFVSHGDLLRAAWRLLRYRPRITGDHRFGGVGVTGLVNAELARTVNGTGPYQYFHYAFAKGLAEACPISTFVQTSENNPWERMCVMALRDGAPDARIVGYQHAVVPQASVNMFPGKGEAAFAPLPDVILTTGDIPRRIMQDYGDYDEGRLATSCGLRYEYLRNVSAAERRKPGKTVLLALEGIPEVSRMVEYVLREIGSSAECEIVVRTHPVLPFDEIAKSIPGDLLAESSYRVSKGVDLATDIAAADAVIYWGTTVAMEALKAGKPVIHFDTGSILSYDPLFECEHLKWRVTAGDRLAETLQEVFTLGDEEFGSEREKAARYLEDYFHAVSADGLAPFTAQNGMSQ